jgi:hypothetical protein
MGWIGGGRRRKRSGLLVWERSSVGEDKGGRKIHVHSLSFVNNKIIKRAHALAIYVNSLYLCVNSVVRIVVLNRPTWYLSSDSGRLVGS